MRCRRVFDVAVSRMRSIAECRVSSAKEFLVISPRRNPSTGKVHLATERRILFLDSQKSIYSKGSVPGRRFLILSNFALNLVVCVLLNRLLSSLSSSVLSPLMRLLSNSTVSPPSSPVSNFMLGALSSSTLSLLSNSLSESLRSSLPNSILTMNQFSSPRVFYRILY